MATKKIFILGIQSLTSSEDSTLRFGNDNTIIIPFPEGIDELHKLSTNFTEKGRIAKKLLDYFSMFRVTDLLSDDGVRQKNGSILRFEKGYHDVEISKNVGNLSPFNKRRIQIALGLKNKLGRSVPIIVISKSPAFRMKLQSIGIRAQPFKDDIFPALEDQYKGRISCKVSDERLDLFYSRGYLEIKEIIKYNEIEWIPNLFLTISSLCDPNHTILARYDGKNIVPLKYSESRPYGINAKKVGQHMALEALLSSPDEAPIVIIKGGAGTGKTILSMACALQKTTEPNDKIYSQILVTTPTETLREENLGYLPGALEQKFDPYLGGIMDNLTLLLRKKKAKKEKNNNNKLNNVKKHNLGSDPDDDKEGSSDSQTKTAKERAKLLIEQGTIVLQLIGHLRGRSIIDTVFIIDEAQNIEPSVIKSIVTRAGEGSKFIFLGDPTQIDNPELNERYNGLVYLSEKMKGNSLCWQVTLEDEESVRSKLAYVAAKIL